MRFIDRQEELARLDGLAAAEEGGLAVVYGRRRVGPASRWWHGAQPEWDLASGSIDGRRVLLGEVKWSARPFNRRTLEPALRELATKPAPPLPARWTGAELVRALFVPEVTTRPEIAAPELEGAMLITAADLLDG